MSVCVKNTIRKGAGRELGEESIGQSVRQQQAKNVDVSGKGGDDVAKCWGRGGACLGGRGEEDDGCRM